MPIKKHFEENDYWEKEKLQQLILNTSALEINSDTKI